MFVRRVAVRGEGVCSCLKCKCIVMSGWTARGCRIQVDPADGDRFAISDFLGPDFDGQRFAPGEPGEHNCPAGWRARLRWSRPVRAARNQWGRLAMFAALAGRVGGQDAGGRPWRMGPRLTWQIATRIWIDP